MNVECADKGILRFDQNRKDKDVPLNAGTFKGKDSASLGKGGMLKDQHDKWGCTGVGCR